MGYGIMPYSVNIERLINYYGSGDSDFKARVLSQAAGQLNSLDQSFDPVDGWDRASQILDDYIAGHSFAPVDVAAKHWYVFEILIGRLGTCLPNREWYPIRSQNLDFFFSESAFRLFFLDKKQTIKIVTPDDFPTVFTVENQNLEAVQLKTDASDLPDDQKAQLKDWLTQCVASDEDLVLFYY